MKKQLSCKEIVAKLLSLVPELRDNDIKLIQEVWMYESGLDMVLLEMKVESLFKMMVDKKLSHPSSIKRARAKLQSVCPEYRGKMYEKRHKLQDNMLDELEIIDAESPGPDYRGGW